MVMLAMMFFMASAFASTRYDRIVVHPEWTEIIQKVDKYLTPNRVIMDYLNLLVNKNDLNQLIRSGELDKDKSKFISENSEVFLKYLHYIIFVHHLSSIKPDPTDAKFMYITGVIKDPRAQAAKTGPEYEMEKTFFRSMPLYAIWEHWRADGALKTAANQQIDLLYGYIKKK